MFDVAYLFAQYVPALGLFEQYPPRSRHLDHWT